MKRLHQLLLLSALIVPIAAPAAETLAPCDVKDMSTVEHRGLSNQEAGQACKVMVSALGRQPSAKLAETMFKMLFGFKYLGYKVEPKEIAYHVMSVIEARGQSNKPDASMIATMNALIKCYQGSNGQVVPKDFAIALRAMDRKQAAGFSDDFMYTLGAMIQQEKRARGE